MARPLKEINWSEVEKRMEAGNSAKVIAACLRIDLDTFYTRFKKEFGCSYQDYSVTFRQCGPGNIQFVQYMKALGGSIPMLTLLGKEWLGQGKDDDNMSKDNLAQLMEDFLKGQITQRQNERTSTIENMAS